VLAPAEVFYYLLFMSSIIVYIDGENFLHKIKSILKTSYQNYSPQLLTKIKLKHLIPSIFPHDKIDQIRYYAAKIHTHPQTQEKSKELIQFQRVFKSNLEKQSILFIKSGNVRAQELNLANNKTVIFKEKGVDVQIAVDLVSMSCNKQVSKAIICSSDSDLQPAVTELKKRSVETIYLGFETSPNKGLMYTTDKTILFRTDELISALPINTNI
jgi:uncharacterized LabA/DUF88 family protein